MRIEPLSPVLGAEVFRDLGEPLDEGEIAELRAAFDTHHLLLFRNQRLEPADQQRVVSHLGPLVERESYISNLREEAVVDLGELHFHRDLAFAKPLHGISLYGETVHPGSAPTRFVNTRLGYLSLDADRRRDLEGRAAMFVWGYECWIGRDRPQDPSAHPARAVQPLVMPHPRTGEPVLFVAELGPYRLEGLSLEEGDAFLQPYIEHQFSGAFEYAHAWAEGDLVVWDNITLAHARQPIAGAPPRSLRRVSFGPPDCFDYLAKQPEDRDGLVGPLVALRQGAISTHAEAEA